MKQYTTTDLNFAAVLKSLEKRFIGLNYEDKFRKRFVFEDDGEIENIKVDYINNKLRVDPLKLWDNVKALKSLCHDEY